MMNEKHFNPSGDFSPNNLKPSVLVVGSDFLSDVEDFHFAKSLIKKHSPKVVVVGSLNGSEDTLLDVCDRLKRGEFDKAKRIFTRDFLNEHKNIAEKLEISFNSMINIFTQFMTARLAEGEILDTETEMRYRRQIMSFGEQASCFLLREYLSRKTTVIFSYVEAVKCISARDFSKGEGSGVDYETSVETIGHILQSNTRLIITEGGISKDYLRFVSKNGPDVTGALFASSYLNLGQIPTVVYLVGKQLEERLFQHSNKNMVHVNYEQFFAESKQSYILQEAVELLQLKGIPFEIISKKNSKSIVVTSSQKVSKSMVN